MSGGVSFDIGPSESDPVSLEVPGGEFSGVDRLVDMPGIDAEDLRGLTDAKQVTFAGHGTSMYVICGR